MSNFHSTSFSQPLCKSPFLFLITFVVFPIVMTIACICVLISQLETPISTVVKSLVKIEVDFHN